VQRRHPLRHLVARAGVATMSATAMFTGLYPLVPHAMRSDPHARSLRVALVEWATAPPLSAARPLGFAPLPGAGAHGPRPIIVVHGYAMSRACFLPLAYRLARAGLGPIVGFEYWSLGRTAAAARQLGWFIDEVRARTGAADVDVIGHSMGGVVARYYIALGGGDGAVATLVTIGSPHGGTDLSRVGIGHPTRELVVGSKLLARLASAPPPRRTRLVAIWSRADALVPGDTHVAGAEQIVFDDLGHVALLGSRSDRSCRARAVLDEVRWCGVRDRAVDCGTRAARGSSGWRAAVARERARP
jgi:pimeloyl-ACP methyl ester carboxylesterase